MRLSDFIFADNIPGQPLPSPLNLGILKGEGIGPEVIQAALVVLSALESAGNTEFKVTYCGPIGVESELRCGKALSEEVVRFCSDIFSQRGAILCGPGGGRFVYELRKEFDLFCKLVPIKVSSELVHSSRIKPEYLRDVDILLIRENTSGVYQGRWKEVHTQDEGRKAEQSFFYSEKQVRRILEVSARIAGQRSGKMAVALKDSGIPAISALWSDCTADVTSKLGVSCSILNIDYLVYQLVSSPGQFDVIVAPNLFGDILADLGGVLLGSRGLTYSGNFSDNGSAVYQTNHGACYDLAGKDQANPVGQIYSLAMLLRESFGLTKEAALIESSVSEVWRQGWRTADLAEKRCRLAGAGEIGNLIAENLVRLSRTGL